ncbi:MAG: PLP-dependent aminotransferase family protein, partial [Clostridia bacterium]|nr:PLP-dependent aminotransferase family protein [Clostridia bacterium]
GMEYLLSVVARLLPEQVVYAVEDPGYGALHRVLRSHGRALCPIPLDDEGMNEAALRRSGADVACVTPSHQFPMGVTMPAGRRSRLLRWAEETEGRYLIEDDYDSEFRYASRPIPAMQGMDGSGKVIYVGTFSRSVAPGIRVAYLVLPPLLARRYRELFGSGACTVSRFEQQTLRLFIQRGLYSRHLRRSINLYRKKQALLLERLAAAPGIRVSGTGAGLHFLLTVEGKDEAWLVRRAAEKGIQLRGLSAYCLEKPPLPGTVAVGFAGLQTEEIPAAARTLIEVFTK